MKIFSKIAAALGAACAVIAGAVLIRTWTSASRQISVPAIEHAMIDNNGAVRHLMKGLQFKTVSYDDPGMNDYRNLIKLRDYIDSSYPLVRAGLTRTIINKYSLLYYWKGEKPDLQPIILLAHMDVVPADRARWTHEPFSGLLVDGFIWGRGALDDKGSLFSILEAVEYLLKSGYAPRRSIYLAFGHDEEAGTTGGFNGARHIARYLATKGVRADFVIDEGSVMLDEGLSPVKGGKFALVGIAEKGFITLRITAAGKSGHSSMPPKETAIGLLARSLTALENDGMPSSLNGIIGTSFDYFGPEMPFLRRMLFANRWIFGTIIKYSLEQSPATAAMLRTTMAPTIIKGGDKESSLPASASAVINFRILPGETSRDIMRRVRSAIKSPQVSVERFGTVIHEPSPVSDPNGSRYRAIERTIREVFPDVKVAPGLVAGRTDSLYYREVTDAVFRFAPYLFGRDDLSRVHGSNERISVKSYLDMIQFYIRLIQNSARDGK